jgi:hypothetical protein
LFLLSFKRLTTMCIRITRLEENYTFSIESQGKRVRLVVYRSAVEKVCRLETRKNLEKLLLPDENHLFKGRLQLNKSRDGIGVIVKGKTAG